MHYLPASEDDVKRMLAVVGVPDVEALLAAVPREVQLKGSLPLPPALSESEVRDRFGARATKNTVASCYPCFLGAGAYDHYGPAAVDAILSRSEFYTSYTPYQPELAQGTLQTIFEFQTMMADLTGMDASNASLYDGASAAAEAALMASRLHKGRRVLVARSLHPAYRAVLRTYLQYLDLAVEEVAFGADGRVDLEAYAKAADGACVFLVGQPNFFGVVEDLKAIAAAPAGHKPLLAAVVAEALSLAALEPPGRCGADLCAGEARSFGLPLGFGGPYLGFLTAKREYMRQLPGRICGQTVDADGRRGFVLTLTTREQHIRREKATSNICTNQGLCMLAATVYLALLGRRGLSELAVHNLSKAEYLKKALAARGVETLFGAPTFNEFAVCVKGAAGAGARLFQKQLLGGYALGRDYPDLAEGYLLCATERVTKSACDRLAEALGDLS